MFIRFKIKVTVNVFWMKISICRFLNFLVAELSRYTTIPYLKLTEVLNIGRCLM